MRVRSIQHYRYRFRQFKKKNPQKYGTLTNRITTDLNELEKALSSSG
jgi:hypothetical protein